MFRTDHLVFGAKVATAFGKCRGYPLTLALSRLDCAHTICPLTFTRLRQSQSGLRHGSWKGHLRLTNDDRYYSVRESSRKRFPLTDRLLIRRQRLSDLCSNGLTPINLDICTCLWNGRSKLPILWRLEECPSMLRRRPRRGSRSFC